MKNSISMFLALLLLPSMLTSCAEQKYEINYPDIYTPEYCVENYVDADPNLEHLYSAENSIGTSEVNGTLSNDTFYAIKNVPVDEYLCVRHIGMFAPTSAGIVKNKNKELPVQEILSYKIIKIESIWMYPERIDRNDITYRCFSKLGIKKIYKSLSTITGEDVEAFQSHIINCLKTENYKSAEISALDGFKTFSQNDGQVLGLRIHFREYENIVWDSSIVEFEGTCYVAFNQYVVNELFPNGMWNLIYIPLDDRIKEAVLAQSTH